MLKTIPYTEKYAELWDNFIGESPMATFLHTRRYLSYHKDKFNDMSLLIKDDKSRVIGLFLAAINPNNPKEIISHPGITYGGILHKGGLRGEKMIQAFQAIGQYYATNGFDTLRYKAIPNIYHQIPSSDDLYALFRLGAKRYRCDISCTIDLSKRLKPAERRQRGLKKALKNGVQINEGIEFAAEFWSVLGNNLDRKYEARPVHTTTEIVHLHSLFPHQIEFVVGFHNSQVVAGVVLFYTPNVLHTQYIASNILGQEVCALDAIFEYCIDKAKTKGVRYFNFGISTENDGQYLNTGLYQFKVEFGGGGIIHEFYEINLNEYRRVTTMEMKGENK